MPSCHMYMISLVSVLCLIGTSKASNNAEAAFGSGDTGITGYVRSYKGFVWLNLDFTGVDWTDLPENCSTDGFTWHIHNAWNYGTDTADKKGADACSGTYTGGHYDPWFACGPFSDNADCVNKGGCIPPSTIYDTIGANDDDDYLCTPTNYSEVAYTCEVGDWSGKYGKLYLDDNMQIIQEGENGTFGSYWETSTVNLWGDSSFPGPPFTSVVFHCKGQRAFCAPFQRAQSPEQQVDLQDDQTIKTSFDDAGSEFEGMTIEWKQVAGVPIVDIVIPSSANDTCRSWAPYLFAEWPYEADGFEDRTAKKNCDLSALGGIYDPTHSCVSIDGVGNSSSAYCDGGVRCPGNTSTPVTYSCSDADRYFGCAVGDMNARIGAVSPPGVTASDPLSPPLWSLGNKAIVYVCMDTDPSVENICALTVQTNGTEVFDNTPAPTQGDGVNMMNTKLALISTVVSAILCVFSL